MEKEKVSVWKSSLNYGLYLGIAIVLVSVAYYATGNTFAKSSQWVGYVLMIGGIIYAQLNYRKSLGGAMTYGEALGVGVLTLVFASLISSVYTYILYTVIDPSLQEQMRLVMEEQLVNQGKLPEEQIEMAIQMASKFQSPMMMFFMGIFGGALTGLIISLITSIFTQKKPADAFAE